MDEEYEYGEDEGEQHEEPYWEQEPGRQAAIEALTDRAETTWSTSLCPRCGEAEGTTFHQLWECPSSEGLPGKAGLEVLSLLLVARAATAQVDLQPAHAPNSGRTAVCSLSPFPAFGPFRRARSLALAAQARLSVWSPACADVVGGL